MIVQCIYSSIFKRGGDDYESLSKMYYIQSYSIVSDLKANCDERLEKFQTRFGSHQHLPCIYVLQRFLLLIMLIIIINEISIYLFILLKCLDLTAIYK